ncbi:MAG: hypothetical protein H6Q15_156 [Bacteroidetes bacterium]|nr:hypothetical protein [Bacteroidota bacterium]
MKAYLTKTFLLITIIISLFSCATQQTSTIVGGDYNELKNETEYFVLPFGSVTIPGKWEKNKYNNISRQQFFTNQDSVIIAIAFSQYNKYEFNMDGSLTGYNFIKNYYEWDSKYLTDSYGLKREILVNDSINNYMIYRIYGDNYNMYFLINEKKGNMSNYFITTDKWDESKKVAFLRELLLSSK